MSKKIISEFLEDLEQNDFLSAYNQLIYYTPDFENKSLKEYRKEIEEKLSSKANISYWGGPTKDYFMNFRSNNCSGTSYDQVKLYIPLNGENVVTIVTKIFDFIYDNNIEHLSKISSNTRVDDFVIRVSNIDDAKKIIDFINNDDEICAGLFKYTIPFDVKCGRVSLGYDAFKSFHCDVADYIDAYRKRAYEKEEHLSLEGFKSYMNNLYKTKYKPADSKYDDHLSGIESKFDFTTIYSAKHFKGNFHTYQLNTLNIMKLIMNNLEGNNTFEDYIDYYNMLKSDSYKNEANKLIKNMYEISKEGKYFEATFSYSGPKLREKNSENINFYQGRVNGCVGIAIEDIETSSNMINAEDMLDGERTGVYYWKVSDLDFFIKYGMNDLDKKTKVEQEREDERYELLKWLSELQHENSDLLNKCFKIKNNLYAYDMLIPSISERRIVQNNFVGNNSYSCRSIDYYLGYLSKLLELEEEELTSTQMQAIITQKEMCKEKLLEEIKRNTDRCANLDITSETDLEKLAISTLEQFEKTQKQVTV